MKKDRVKQQLFDRMTVGETAYLILHGDVSRFSTLREWLLGSEDSDPIHEMRVANRRIRVAIKIFRSFLSEDMIRLEPELNWAFLKLGAVRDLDIEIEKLARVEISVSRETEGLCELRGKLLAERASSKKDLDIALKSDRFEVLVASLKAQVALGPPSRRGLTSTPILAVAPDLVAKRYRKALKRCAKISKNSPSSRFHDLRKKTKKFRYAIEFVRDLYAEEAGAMIARLKELQELLGKRQDDAVTSDHLKKVAADNGLTRGATKLANKIERSLFHEVQQCQRKFAELEKCFVRKEWKDLKKAMAHRRRALWDG